MPESAVVDLEYNFEPETRRVLGRLRAAFSSLVTGASDVSGETIRTAADLQNALGLRSTLAWQVLRFIRADDPLEEAESIPGKSALGLLVNAARTRGVSEGRITEFEAAIEAFEELVHRHAGNRKAFLAMANGVGNGTTDPQCDPQQRREAFDINSRIWGIRLGSRLACYVMFPSDSQHIDIAAIYGVHDLLRLHGQAPYELSRSRFHRELQTGDETIFGRPLNESLSDASGPSLLDPFCSEPRPIVRRFVDQSDHLVAELIPPKLGRQGATTAYMAEVFRKVGKRYAEEDPDAVVTAVHVQTPTKVLVVDILIAEGTYGQVLPRPRAQVLRNFTGVAPPLVADKSNDVLDQPSVVHLGCGAAVLESPDVPRYPEMVTHVCEALGWDPDVFHVFRCRIEYPVMPSMLWMQYEKPE